MKFAGPKIWIYTLTYSSYGGGGWDRYTRNLIKYLPSAIPIGIIAHKAASHTRLPSISAPLSPRNRISVYLDYLYLLALTRAIGGLELVHFPSQRDFMFDVVVKASRYVMTIHGLSFLHAPTDPHYVKKVLILRRKIHVVSAIITVSKWAKRDIIRFFKVKPDKVKVIYNCVDRKIFNERKHEYDDAILKTLGINKPYILHVSGGDRTKNIEYIIKALKDITVKELRLVLVGITSQNLSRIINYARSHGVMNRIKILRPIYNDAILAALYRNALAFVMPSLHESCPFALLEAMSCGTPCIVSKHAALPEIAGDAALYIDTSQPLDLANTVVDLYRGKYELFNKRGIDRVNTYFNIKQFVKKHIAVYEEVLTQGAS